MNTKEIINKLGNILEQYKEDQLKFYTQYQQKFIRNNFDDDQTIIDVLNNSGSWETQTVKEGFAYDIGYVEGLEEAIRILKEE